MNSLTRLIAILFVALLLAGCASVPGTTAVPTPESVALRAEAPALFERIAITDDLSVRRIQNGVYVFTHAFPWPANSMVVEMADSRLVLVDTPYTPEATRDLLDWIETQLGEREITAINTGFHNDNLGGNRTLIEQGIPVYGADLTVEMLAERFHMAQSYLQSLNSGSSVTMKLYRDGSERVISFQLPDLNR